MENFNKKTEPKIISNLSSNHTLSKTEGPKPQQMQQPNQSFVKHDSASFKETKIKYENQISPIPNLNQNGNNRTMPQIEYTKEETLVRPIADKEKRLNIQSEEKETLSFSKSIVEPVKPFEPTISFDNVENKEQDIKKKKETENKKKKFLFHSLIIFIELLILGCVLYFREQKIKTTLECTNQSYSEYYHANIVNTKKYSFKKGNIVKLEDTFTYIFDTEDAYQEFINVSANPEKEEIKGRLFTTTMDDNKKEYIEKTIYDFSKLREQNESEQDHTILVHTKEESDSIELLDYNSTDMKLIYESDYVCK